jgi:hypothetical protein
VSLQSLVAEVFAGEADLSRSATLMQTQQEAFARLFVGRDESEMNAEWLGCLTVRYSAGAGPESGAYL